MVCGEEGGICTNASYQRPNSEEEQVNRLLLALEVGAYLVHIADEAGVPFYERILALGVQGLALGGDARAGFLRAADEVYARLAGVLRELLQRRLADAIGGTDEDGDEAGGEGGRDASVGGLYGGEGYHCVVWNGGRGKRTN